MMLSGFAYGQIVPLEKDKLSHKTDIAVSVQRLASVNITVTWVFTDGSSATQSKAVIVHPGGVIVQFKENHRFGEFANGLLFMLDVESMIVTATCGKESYYEVFNQEVPAVEIEFIGGFTVEDSAVI